MNSKIANIQETFRNSNSQSKQPANDYGDQKFKKFTELIRQKCLVESEFQNAISSMNEKINQKNIPYRLKRDYESMKFLVTYNQRLHVKFSRKMEKMKKIRNQTQKNISFGVVQREIKKSNRQLKISQFLNLDIENVIKSASNWDFPREDGKENLQRKQKISWKKFGFANKTSPNPNASLNSNLNHYENSMHKFEGLKALGESISPRNQKYLDKDNQEQKKNYATLTNFNQNKNRKQGINIFSVLRKQNQDKNQNKLRGVKTSNNQRNTELSKLKGKGYSQIDQPNSTMQRARNKAASFKKQQFFKNQVKDKIQLLSEILQQNQLTKISKTIEKQIDKFNLECEPENLAQKMRRYIVNHIILQKFLSLICQDVNRIQNKNKQRFKEIYLKIKAEMVSIKSDEENFMEKLASIRQYQEQQIKENQFSQNQRKQGKNKKTIAKKAFFSHYSTKENQLIEQIQKIFLKANYFLKDAYAKCGKQDKKSELDQILKRKTVPEIMMNALIEQ